MRALAACFVALLVGPLWAGCFGDDDDPLEMRRLDVGTQSGHDYDDLDISMVLEAGDWQNFWEVHTSIYQDPPPLPPVDFDHEYVAAFFLGTRPTGGYIIEIVGAELDGDIYVFQYRTVEPDPDCAVTTAVTQPFDIVAIDRIGDGVPSATAEQVKADILTC